MECDGLLEVKMGVTFHNVKTSNFMAGGKFVLDYLAEISGLMLVPMIDPIYKAFHGGSSLTQRFFFPFYYVRCMCACSLSIYVIKIVVLIKHYVWMSLIL